MMGCLEVVLRGTEYGHWSCTVWLLLENEMPLDSGRVAVCRVERRLAATIVDPIRSISI
jgi:hypothetical protein